jgi:DNA-binding MarR family transcriptional regulator
MAPEKHFDEEQRTQWMAFAQSILAASDPRAMRLMDEFRMVSHQLYQLNETSLAAAGLSYAQFRLLMSLYFCEWRGDCEGLNPSEISDRQGTSRNTISGLIKSLEDEGLVVRHLDRDDRRRFNIQLTEAGRQIIRDHSRFHSQIIERLFQELEPGEIETLSALLQKLNRRAKALKEAGIGIPPGDLHASD